MNTVTTTHKDTAIDFLSLAASGNAKEAFRLYVGEGFRHHNPYFKGDADSLMNGMDENAAENPDKVLEIWRVLEDGDYVTLHARVRMNPNDTGWAVVHIFRFENDRIVELWDVGQEIPEDSPNEYGMF